MGLGMYIYDEDGKYVEDILRMSCTGFINRYHEGDAMWDLTNIKGDSEFLPVERYLEYIPRLESEVKGIDFCETTLRSPLYWNFFALEGLRKAKEKNHRVRISF